MEINTLKRKYFIDIFLEDERRSSKIKENGKNPKEKHDIPKFPFFKGKEGNGMFGSCRREKSHDRTCQDFLYGAKTLLLTVF